MSYSQRYLLHAYICGPDCVQWRDHIGTTTFTNIMLWRPDMCRYAIIENSTDNLREQRKYYVADLYDCALIDNEFKEGEMRVFDDLDVAVAFTTMTYRNE